MLGRDDVHEGGLLGGAGGAGRRAAGSDGVIRAAAASDGAAAPDQAAQRTSTSPAGPPRARAPRVARRAWLAGGFLAALGVLLALNWSSAFGAVGDPARGLAPDFRQALSSLRGPVRIGLQVGHLHETAMPRELAKLRTSTGAEVGGLNEVDVNLAIVRVLAARLRALGFKVDVLGATVPVGYRATLVLAVHTDASPDAQREGYKSAHYLPVRNARDPLLKLEVDRAVLGGTALGDDDANVSIDMLEYYAFNARRFRHAVARATPALIVEMGYLTNDRDRTLLRSPGPLAAALADGIVHYLHDVQRIPPGPPLPAGAPARADGRAAGSDAGQRGTVP